MAMYEVAKKLEPTRPVHYEGQNAAADIDSHMYPSIANMSRFDQQESDKPYFLCDVAHSMGNASRAILPSIGTISKINPSE